MNERIRELATQAGINCVVPAVGSLEYPSKGEIEHLKKFAELIVRECCQFNYDFLESYREACEVNGKIREHFGVEE